ncbi:MAG: VWA domain-containing protein [Ignavibacteria bacterium]|nr:VWA domain-containing protein [Ignavibacteria bacterium]
MSLATMSLARTLRVSLFIVVLIALFGAATPEARTQPQLNFKRIANNWPTIALFFTTACNGQPAYFTDKRFFKVYENGVEVGQFDLWCPDPTMRVAISAALVFDASGSMAGSNNVGARAGGNAFVDIMDGVSDEAAIIWFTSMVTVAQGMTVWKDLLHNAIKTLPASGATAVWDGCYFGLLELINNGVNPARAVVVMTDGGDNSSSRNPDEIIALASRNRIRVFCIGLGGSVDSILLQKIADQTGGRYYETPSAGNLPVIYQEISTILYQGFQACVIPYTATCKDGAFRKVDLSVINFCNGQDTKTKTYQAPKDTSTFTQSRLQLGKRETLGDTDAKVPLLLLDQMHNELFYGASFSVRFDTTRLQFKGISTPPGSQLEGLPITIATSRDTVRFTTAGKKLLNTQSVPALLAELTFRVVNPFTTDTLHSPLDLTGWSFEAGCRKPVLLDGEITILPLLPEVTCTMSAPTTVFWNEPTKTYLPSPFTVNMSITNIGQADVVRPRYRITIKSTDFELVNPITDTVSASVGRLAPAASNAVSWQLNAKQRGGSDTCRIAITATFDNYPPVTCERFVLVPKVSSFASCSITVPDIAANEPEQKYDPMPFPITVTVKNNGIAQSDSIRVRLTLPAGLEYASPDSPAASEKFTVPVLLAPGMEGQQQWMVRHPVTPVEKRYLVRVETQNGPFLHGDCGATVVIPRLLPRLTTSIAANGALSFCEGGQVQLNAGGVFSTYKWSHGPTVPTVNIKVSGKYWVTVTDSLGRSAVSDTVTVTVHPNPVPRLTPSGQVTICMGDTLTIDAGAGYASYRWSSGDTTRRIRVASEGIWTARVRSTAGCEGFSDSVITALAPMPPKPSITRSNDTLQTQPAFRNQWYRNDVPIPGAVSAFLPLTAPGRYMVAAINAFGCRSLSDPFDVGSLPVGDLPRPLAWTLDVFPDPSSGSISISARGVGGNPVTISILDASGRVIVPACELGAAASQSSAFQLADQPAGVYFVSGVSRGVTQVRKFVVVK